ncbi:DUF1254 domain-containing protein [Corallococcus exiguus]|uniref:DUF1254 domain-containing protein n=1 Tax=Corallococcus exiguus TaxID=83462 RepID=UPI001A8DED05|nr:DUF1254 domain-containing protein [Corallococcus exiguus]MBN8470567.1 DUF1254 domain-containing protein [Corallococcus exiguus]
MTTRAPGQTPAGFPTPEVIQRAHDEAELGRAIQAYRFFYPTVSMEGAMYGQQEAGAQDNQGALLLAGGPRHVLFTGNSDTPYLGAILDLKKAGPMVVEIPPGPFMGIVNDHHYRWIHDIGLPGPDAGKGGKHLLLPPGHESQVPSGYFVARSTTYKLLVGLRAIPDGDDLQGAMALMRKARLHPLAASGPDVAIRDVTDQGFDITCLRWEDNLQYWEKLHKVLQEEPTFDEFRPMYGLLATLGIQKGKPFAPDSRMRSLLERAARTGREQMLVAGFASQRPDRVVWTDRQWEWIALNTEDANFELPTGLDVEARDRWFAQAIGASPAMIRRTPGAGSLYWLALRDRNGAYLDGGKTYKLTVPQPVPARLFWSATVYDNATRSQIQTDQDKAALRSLVELKDAAKDQPVDLYFGPQAPAGQEGRWIQTLPGKGWFLYFRIYGPDAPAFNGSWKPDDLEEVRPVRQARA